MKITLAPGTLFPQKTLTRISFCLVFALFALLPLARGQQTEGTALKFDGVDDKVTTSFAGVTGTTSRTIEFWMKTSATSGCMIAYGTDVAFGRVSLSVNASGNIFVAFHSSNFTTSGAVVNNGQWHHVAYVFDNAASTKSKLYIDGMLRGSSASSGTGVAPNIPVHLGFFPFVNNSPQYYNGELDELRIWNIARTDAEIVSTMNCQVPGAATGLLLNYHFNQGIGAADNTGLTNLPDASGNGNNGTLNNFALTGAASNWAAPGSAASGSACPGFSGPEMRVQANGQAIADGDGVPSISDHTDFGNVDFGGNTSRTFTVQNFGTGSLSLNGSTTIAISGTDAADFSVTTSPMTSISPSAWTNFEITFTPSAVGLRTANISIANNDADENPYNFTISGMGVLPSNLNVGNIGTPACANTTCSDDDTYTANVTVNYASKPATGTLALSGADIVGTPPSVSVGDIGTNSHTFTGVSLRADGQSISLTATFSADGTTIENTNAGLAPDCSGNLQVAAGCGDVQFFTITANGVSGNGSPTWHLDLPGGGGSVTEVDVVWDDTEWVVLLNGGASFFATAPGIPDYPPCTGWTINPADCNNGGTFTVFGACGGFSTPCDVSGLTAGAFSGCNDNRTASSADDYFTTNVTVNFAYAPASGNLVLRRGATILASKPAADLQCSTSWTFDDVEMSADGASVVLIAEFSASCSFTSGDLGTAPASCSCIPTTEICNGVDDDCDTQIDENNTLATNLTAIAATCAGSSNGTVYNDHSGGTAPFTYLWSNAKTTKTSTCSSPERTP